MFSLLLIKTMPFNRLNHHILGEIRPRFALKINCEPEKALEHLREVVQTDKTVLGVRAKTYCFLKIPMAEQHYWSPEMSVRIEKADYLDYTTVHCLVGPRQSIWVLFSLIYAALAIITIFGGMFGVVEYDASGSSLFIWVIPIGIILISTIFITAKLGQRKGRDQMLHLVSFVYHHLSEIAEVERVPGS